MARRRRIVTWGGKRAGAGRRSLFPNKGTPVDPANRPSGDGPGVKFTVFVTRTAYNAAVDEAERLTTRKPRMRTADDVDQVSLSDAVEYLIRKGTGTPFED